MTTRQALQRLLDTLPDELLPAAEARLTALRDDPFLRYMLALPEVDELTAEEVVLVEESEAEIARCETISLAEFEHRYGTADRCLGTCD